VLEGAIPTDLDGVYLRNTENPVHEPLGRYHPFDGDGMVHQIEFKDGKAAYRNRFIRTRGFEAEQEAGEAPVGRPDGRSRCRSARASARMAA
jgi:carotenoid cleavage dioxygenase-like enzyme